MTLGLQHYLTVKLRDEVPVGHLYVAFREHVATGKSAEVLADVRRYAGQRCLPTR